MKRLPRHRAVPRALVLASRSDGRAVPVRYVHGGHDSRHEWMAVVRVPLSRDGVTVSVEVRTPRTAVLLETGLS